MKQLMKFEYIKTLVLSLLGAVYEFLYNGQSQATRFN